MNRALRDVRDPEVAQRALEDDGIFVESWDYDPLTRMLRVESPADPYDFEIAAIKAGLHVEYGITTHGMQRQRGAR